MATLTGDVDKQNIVDRYEDFVTTTANAGIIWGTDALPFVEMSSAEFDGTTSGRNIVATGPDLAGPDIDASSIVSVLVAESVLYTNIRKCQAILFVTGEGGNTGSRPVAGIIFDDTQVSHLATGYRQSITTGGDPEVQSMVDATAAGLETFFTNLQTEYNTRRNTTETIQTNVCHAACHSSCHGARGRR